MLDIGAIRHIICFKGYFSSFENCEETVNWGSASSMRIEGTGHVFIRFLDSGFVLLLKDCLFMPSLGLNLILTSKLKGIHSLVTPERAIMFQKSRLLTIGEQV